MNPSRFLQPKHVMKLLLVTAFVLASVNVAHAETFRKEGAKVGEWTQDFPAAKALAIEKKLPILLNFTGSDWCGWCKFMDRKVFEQSAWQAFARQNLVLVAVDFPRDKTRVTPEIIERNNALKDEWGAVGYPSFIITNPEATAYWGSLSASRDAAPESFIAEVKSSIALFKGFSDELRAEHEQARKRQSELLDKINDWMSKSPEVNEENKKVFAAMNKEYDAAKIATEDLLMNERARRLPEDKSRELLETYKQQKDLNEEATAWYATNPEQDDAFKKKMADYTARIQALQASLKELSNLVK